jgi:type III secretion protein Q
MARREATLLRRCVRRAALPDMERARHALAGLLGTAPHWVTEAPSVHRAEGMAGGLPDWPAAVALTDGTAGAAVLELEPDLALWAIGQALGSGGGRAWDPAGPLTDGERGVLGYLVARVLAAGGAALRVAHVLGSRDALVRALGEGPVVVWPAHVHIEDRVYRARAMAPEGVLDRLPEGPQGTAAAHLAALRLTLRVEAGWARLPLAELRTLRPGDTLVLDEAWVTPGLEGPPATVRLRAAGARRTAWWCTAGDGGLRLERVERSAESPTGEGRRMQDTNGTATIVDRTGDAPVEVTVELARFTLPLEELGRLSPGEVVVTGRTIGERVVLRAGDRALATGELVDVDGEVGVRVLELTQGP